MNQTIERENKAMVLEAFDTLFNKREYDPAEYSGRPAIQAARKAISTIPNSAEVNEVPDANRIQGNCSQ
jgi:hypothetical protein